MLFEEIVTFEKKEIGYGILYSQTYMTLQHLKQLGYSLKSTDKTEVTDVEDVT